MLAVSALSLAGFVPSKEVLSTQPDRPLSTARLQNPPPLTHPIP
jgi:hypothetical protein